MIDDYIDSFQTGSIDKHKDSQKKWVKDRSPIVETNMGWIETYIDLLGVRGYYEGWVALLNKEQSVKLKNLVDSAPEILEKMPWSKDFEKDEFRSPDFIALDVVCFATTGCPVGINIPNYTDVQEDSGFKNISLSNAYPSFKKEHLEYCVEEDKDILVDFSPYVL